MEKLKNVTITCYSLESIIVLNFGLVLQVLGKNGKQFLLFKECLLHANPLIFPCGYVHAYMTRWANVRVKWMIHKITAAAGSDPRNYCQVLLQYIIMNLNEWLCDILPRMLLGRTQRVRNYQYFVPCFRVRLIRALSFFRRELNCVFQKKEYHRIQKVG